MDAVTHQPTKVDIQKAILNFTGNIVSLRAFKMSGPSKLHKIGDEEFKKSCIELSPKFGMYLEIRVPRSLRKQPLLIKKSPESIDRENVDPTLIIMDKYQMKYTSPFHPAIGNGIKQFLIREGHVHENIV